jgi:hypothetical protein
MFAIQISRAEAFKKMLAMGASSSSTAATFVVIAELVFSASLEFESSVLVVGEIQSD